MMPLPDFIYAGRTPSGLNSLQMPYMEFVQTSPGHAIFAYATLILLALAALYCTITILFAFIAWIIRRIRKHSVLRDPAYRLHLLLCVAGAGVIANIIWLVMSLLTYASRATITIHLAVNIAYIAIAVISVLFLFVKLRKMALSRSQKARYCTTLTATLLIIVNILYWNLCWF